MRLSIYWFIPLRSTATGLGRCRARLLAPVKLVGTPVFGPDAPTGNRKLEWQCSSQDVRCQHHGNVPQTAGSQLLPPAVFFECDNYSWEKSLQALEESAGLPLLCYQKHFSGNQNCLWGFVPWLLLCFYFYIALSSSALLFVYSVFTASGHALSFFCSVPMLGLTVSLSSMTNIDVSILKKISIYCFPPIPISDTNFLRCAIVKVILYLLMFLSLPV